MYKGISLHTHTHTEEGRERIAHRLQGCNSLYFQACTYTEVLSGVLFSHENKIMLYVENGCTKIASCKM